MNIVAEIREEIKAVSVIPSNRDLTILALLFFAIPALIGGYSLWKGNASGWYWIAAGTILGGMRFIRPLFLALYRAWITFSVILGYFVSRIILTIIFFLIITPMGLIMRIVGKDPMDRKWDPEAGTYWSAKEQEKDISVERYEKQF